MTKTPAFKIEKNVPIPDIGPPTGSFAATLQAMEVGDSAAMPRHYQIHLFNAAKKAGISVKSRKISETEMRVWRTA